MDNLVKTKVDYIGREVELKRCPMCGDTAHLVHTNDNHHSPYVECDGAIKTDGTKRCFVCLYPWRYKTDEEAIEAWNRRTPEWS